MIRTQRIRRISPIVRRPQRRPTIDRLRGARRLDLSGPQARRAVAPRPGALPPPARPGRPRPRRRWLRLVVVNARPRRRRRELDKPVLRLLRGRAPSLARPRRVAPPRIEPPEPRSRVAQLVFVMALAAIGLVALATSVGQILTRTM